MANDHVRLAFTMLFVSWGSGLITLNTSSLRCCVDEEKEPEMVIGFPTDVKHVAHIGMDGPSNAPPSWVSPCLYKTRSLLRSVAHISQFFDMLLLIPSNLLRDSRKIDCACK